MLYFSDLFNHTGLFLRLQKWRTATAPARRGPFDSFLFRAASAISSLMTMDMYHSLSVQQFLAYQPGMKLEGGNKVIFWSPILMQLIQQFSLFLTSLRIMQNEILPLIVTSTSNKKDIPLSLNDALKKGNSYGVDPKIWETIQIYWDTNGSELRDYRDIDHHFFMLCRSAFMELNPDKRLLIYLPDNPKERSQKKISFDKKREAVPYFKTALSQIHQVTDTIAEILGFPSSKYIHAFHIPEGAYVPGVERTIGLFIVDPLARKAVIADQGIDKEIRTMREAHLRPPASSDGDPKK